MDNLKRQLDAAIITLAAICITAYCCFLETKNTYKFIEFTTTMADRQKWSPKGTNAGIQTSGPEAGQKWSGAGKNATYQTGGHAHGEFVNLLIKKN